MTVLRRTRGPVGVQVTSEPPRAVASGWLLRLKVANHGPARDLEAEVTALDAAGSSASAAWPLPWRAHEGASRIHLKSGTSELVRLAVAHTARAHPELVVLAVDGRNERRAPIAPDHSVFVTIRSRDGKGDPVVARARVTISFREHDLFPRVDVTSGDAVDPPPPTPVAAAAAKPTPPTAIPAGSTAAPAPAAPAPPAPAPPSAAPVDGPEPDRRIPLEARRLTPRDLHHLQDILRCTVCGSTYEVSDTTLMCTGCPARPAILDGVAILTTDDTVPTTLELHDYDTAHGITEDVIRGIGAEWSGIIERFGLPRGQALEIGAGTGALTLGLLAENAVERLTATDVSEKFLRILGARADDGAPLTLVACDANQPHFRAGAFDLVLGRAVLHHLLDYEDTLANCCEILRPGGAAVFFEPVIEGKAIVALHLALVLRGAEVADDDALTLRDRQLMRNLIRHQVQSKLKLRDREELAQREDKYIFSIGEMRQVGAQVGFADVEFFNMHDASPNYWAYVESTCRQLGIAPQKIDPYRWIGVQFAHTYGAMSREQLVTPMGYFVFRK